MSAATGQGTHLRRVLHEELERRGWSQEQLALKSDLGTASISRVLAGRQDPGLATLYSLSQALEIPLERLVYASLLDLAPDLPPFASDATPDRVAETVRAFPWLAPVVHILAELEESDRRSVLAFLEVQRLIRERETSVDTSR